MKDCDLSWDAICLAKPRGESECPFHLSGQVERVNRTINEATVKRFYYEMHEQLQQHLRQFIDAYNFADV